VFPPTKYLPPDIELYLRNRKLISTLREIQNCSKETGIGTDDLPAEEIE
jgi:hypothetical protein